ncbi:MAG: flavodoxin [Ruminococcus sp.]
MKTIIVYYSLGGFTKSLAEKLAAESGADLLELRPVKAYPSTGARRFITGGRAAVTGKKPPLQTYTFDADRYDRIIFGSPVWASSPAPPLRSFIAENSATVARKAYGAFFTQLGSGADKALKKLAAAAGIADFQVSMVFYEPNKKDAHKENEEKLRKLAEMIQA